MTPTGVTQIVDTLPRLEDVAALVPNLIYQDTSEVQLSSRSRRFSSRVWTCLFLREIVEVVQILHRSAQQRTFGQISGLGGNCQTGTATTETLDAVAVWLACSQAKEMTDDSEVNFNKFAPFSE